MSHPNITISILPNTAGAHSSLSGPIVLLQFPDADDEDVLFLEGALGDTISREDDLLVAEHLEIFAELVDMSLDEASATALLNEIIDMYGQAA